MDLETLGQSFALFQRDYFKEHELLLVRQKKFFEKWKKASLERNGSTDHGMSPLIADEEEEESVSFPAVAQ
jgi:hypothetical protein